MLLTWLALESVTILRKTYVVLEYRPGRRTQLCSRHLELAEISKWLHPSPRFQNLRTDH